MRRLFYILAFSIVNFAYAEATPTNVGIEGGDFELQSSNGPVSLKSMRGKAVLLFFGYTYCPDVCPNTLNFVAGILNSLDARELDYLETLFITIDPERDTPARLAAYTRYFHDTIIGLTGTDREVENVAALYGAQKIREALPKTEITYAFSHSAALYLILPNGKLGYIFPQSANQKDVFLTIKHTLAILVSNTSSSQ